MVREGGFEMVESGREGDRPDTATALKPDGEGFGMVRDCLGRCEKRRDGPLKAEP